MPLNYNKTKYKKKYLKNAKKKNEGALQKLARKN